MFLGGKEGLMDPEIITQQETQRPANMPPARLFRIPNVAKVSNVDNFNLLNGKKFKT